MEIVNIAFLKALGITLFHSIWQATLVALIMSLILSAIKKKKARERYLVSLSALFVLFLTSLVTFWKVYTPEHFSAIAFEGKEVTNIYENILVITNDQGLLSRLNQAVVQNIEWFTLIWGVGMLFFTVKIILEMHFTTSLRACSRDVKDFKAWKLLEELKKKGGFTQFVDLRESIKIKSPSVVGFFKPCIYFPIGLINKLSMEETEAILAHELAHIVRNDFLINILQSTIEIFFYFHPAVWWISANIRNERENACDDLAIDIVGDKVKYAKSLLLLQEWEVNAKSGLAMTLFSKETPLFTRIKRILNQPKNKHDMKQKILASVILLSSIIWISATDASLSTDQMEPEIVDYSFTLPAPVVLDEEEYFVSEMSQVDTLPQKYKESKKIILQLENGEIKELEIDGVTVPEMEFGEYQDLLDDLEITSGFPSGSSSYHFPGELKNLEELELMLEEMRLEQDSLLPGLEGTMLYLEGTEQELQENLLRLQESDFELQGTMRHLQGLERDMQFSFDIQMENVDSIFKSLDLSHERFEFDQDFHGQFPDSLRFNMDSLRAKMDNFRFEFGDLGNEIRIIADSFNFPEMQNEVLEYLEDFNLDGIGDAIRFKLDSFQFPDFDPEDSNFHSDFFGANNLERSFIREMKDDNLFKQGGNDIKLTYDDLEINGQAQPAEIHKRYKDIYESKTGIELLEGSNLHIKIDNSSKKDSRKGNLRKL